MILPCPTRKSQKSEGVNPPVGGTLPGCEKGFTIIELLVTAGLVGIMTAMGVASYNNFNEKRVVKNAAEKLKVNIRYVQAKALAGEKDCSVCGTNCEEPLVGWYVDFTVSPAEIYGQCGLSTFPTPRKTIELNSSLDPLSILYIPGDILEFRPLRGGTNLNPADIAEIEVCGFGCGADRKETVFVTAGGEVK